MDLEVALRNPAKVTSRWSDKVPKPKALERLGELVHLEELRLLGARSLPPSMPCGVDASVLVRAPHLGLLRRKGL